MRDDDSTGRKSRQYDPTLFAIEDLPNALAAILEEHRASRMPFFLRLAGLPRALARDPGLLGQIHLIYQSAMHATRAAVYYLPHLDRPALRKRKLRIFIDDDGLADGDTHHYQLSRAFRSIGAECLLDDEEFGELGELCHYLEAETADFVRLAPNSMRGRSARGVRSRRCRPTGCGLSPTPYPFISRISDTNRISRNASRRMSRNAMRPRPSR